MTDDELNRAVAEIEGWVSDPSPTGRFAWMKHPEHGIPPGRHSGDDVAPPYATDWAWLGPVFEKSIAKDGAGFMERVDTLMYDEDRPLKPAICLAVIAAKGKP